MNFSASRQRRRSCPKSRTRHLSGVAIMVIVVGLGGCGRDYAMHPDQTAGKQAPASPSVATPAASSPGGLALTGAESASGSALASPVVAARRQSIVAVHVGAESRPTIQLTDTAGKPRTLNDFRGKVVALFFGYSQCPDVCGSTMFELRQAAHMLAARRSEFSVVMVSVDGDHDTPEVLASYVHGFDKDFIGLTAKPARVRALAANFGATALPAKTAADRAQYGAWMHNAPVLLLDAAGAWRLTVPAGARAQELANAITGLLDSGSSGQADAAGAPRDNDRRQPPWATTAIQNRSPS